MKAATLILRLFGLLVIAALATGTETAAVQEASDTGPCERVAGCLVCKLETCGVIICSDHIDTDCFE